MYPHTEGNCSITGGYVYRGRRVPEIAGRYVYGDYCSGQIWAFNSSTALTESLLDGGTALTTFGEGYDGELYVAFGNTIFKLISDSPPPPPVPAGSRRSLALLAFGLLLISVISLRGRRGGRRSPPRVLVD